jgi:predicted DsbA family dithiol-disulfide isomerase
MAIGTVEPGTVVVYTDVGCAWSTVAIHRFLRARRALGLDDDVRIDHRLFLLEDVNRAPLLKRVVDAEIGAVAALEPDLGFRVWQGDPSTWPVSTLLANEAVHAAKAQGYAAAEQLDMALRLALFRDSRCITLQHEILEVAASCPAVNGRQLRDDLDSGRARAVMMAQYREYAGEAQGSPHFFLADGTDVHNPGVEMHWTDEGPGKGIPIVDSDDSSVPFDELVRRAAAGTSPASAGHRRESFIDRLRGTGVGMDDPNIVGPDGTIG